MQFGGFSVGVAKAAIQPVGMDFAAAPFCREHSVAIISNIYNKNRDCIFRLIPHRLRHLKPVDVDCTRLAAVFAFFDECWIRIKLLPLLTRKSIFIFPPFPRLISLHRILRVLQHQFRVFVSFLCAHSFRIIVFFKNIARTFSRKVVLQRKIAVIFVQILSAGR